VSRVLLVGKGPPDRGGISAFMQTLMASDLRRHHRLDLLNLYREEMLQGGRFTRANVGRTIADARRLWTAAAAVDIVHINTALVPFATVLRTSLLALTARARGARVIVHAHSGWIDRWLTTPLRRLLVRLLLAPADRVVTVSESSRRFLARALGESRVLLVDNGIDPTHYEPAAPSHHPATILFAGVLSPRKGLIDLIEASKLLQERGLTHRLLIAGGPPEEGPQAEAQARQAAGDGSTIEFLGTLPHESMARLYRGVDVFCLPSWWEAMPLTILEAMASGLPVVASTVGDIPRAVDDSVTGRLVEAQQPALLADALEPLLRDAALRTTMGRAGRRRVEQLFNIHGTCRAIDGIYGDLSREVRHEAASITPQMW
jgi:D-inositol-3-phosphate glycosyltransferase